ncbi:efflux RND transporter permease subunit [Fulvivirgaceae bacterium BMA10]|uniref:Efflux RND transporter permease subunit n=1 Tax=Splendidivirga corallicola TaxID=3051826 RepID=A0ABT8KP67_9BACT|nr:efflux RND transporter permease subunit [Fulvivirgaceae bacterium BMA10]
MWTNVAHNIIKFRLHLIILLAIVTAFMGYKSQEIEWSYDLAKTVPEHDPEMIYFEEFKKVFGEDGNILAIGLKDSAIYTPENFQKFKTLSQEIEDFEGINEVLSLPLLQALVRDKVNRKFELTPAIEEIPADQATLDSLLQNINNLEYYNGQISNASNGATVVLITIEKEVLNSPKRQDLVNRIVKVGDKFSKDTGIELHYAGLPFVRSTIAGKVKRELNFFLMLSVLVTGFIMFLFFRSWDAVVFPMLVIGIIVIWTIGTIALFGFKITLLTGLIPPIIVVIGIPNSIYLLNKYHQEYSIHGNKMKALSRVVRKIGIVTLITNFTTAIGFVVLASADIIILKEFGIVAGINIFATFFVSIILIPGVFSYLPPPSKRQLKHLGFQPLDATLTFLDFMVHRHKNVIFITTAILILVSSYGIYKLDSVSYMVDDIPEESVIKKDLRFFEENFSGIMPMEIVVDTGKKKGVMQLKNLRKVAELEDFLADQKFISKPVSIVSFVKAAKQAYYNNNPKFYGLPNNQERSFIFSYLRDQSDDSGLLNSFVDSTGQKMRVSLKVADIGSKKMDSLIGEVINPKIDEIFADSGITATVTGTTPLFIKGNRFLIENLRFSLLLAFLIISLIMAVLFKNFRMILISLVPNIVPLLITAGIMGFFNIPLKPSTALIFSIAFGISVDDSIHFLAKYRQELFSNNFFVPIAISKSIRETGASMIYTSIVLFAGFVIFAASDFGGTVALGVLASTTLLIAMITNLGLLPSLLLTFDDGKRKKDSHPLIEQLEDFYQEDEDEEIDLDLIKMESTENGQDLSQVMKENKEKEI